MGNIYTKPFGSVIHYGSGVPTPTLGKDTDLYIDELNNNIYYKQSLVWELKGNIKGDNGFKYKLTYSNSTEYVLNDVVFYNGGVYISIVNSTTGNIPTDTNYWGPISLRGATGDKGDQGNPGAKGDDGVSPTVTIGPTGTLLPNQSATVENIGTEQDLILSFGIPKGEQGIKGDTGATGPTGPAGADGEDAPNVQIEYSINGTTLWHTTFATGDKYQRNSVDGGLTWTGAMKFVGEDGEGSGDMLGANNLSELTDLETARENLSVYNKEETIITSLIF